MRRSHNHALIAAALLAIVPAAVASAQWSVTVGVGAARFSGGAEEPATGRSLRPYRPTLLEAGVSRSGRRVGIGIRVHYASSSLALEGADAVAAVKDAIQIYGAIAEVSVRVSRLGPDGVIRGFAGPVFEIWKLPDLGSRSRVGVSGSVGLEVPFGPRWSGVARLGAAVTPASPFEEADLEPTLRRRALWRREVTAELSYRM
jgi:hypothetical protein